MRPAKYRVGLRERPLSRRGGVSLYVPDGKNAIIQRSSPGVLATPGAWLNQRFEGWFSVKDRTRYLFVCQNPKCNKTFTRYGWDVKWRTVRFCSRECRYHSTPIERLWEKVDKNGPIHPTLGTPCWLWQGCLVKGHGQMGVGKKRVYTHRLAYEELVGPIPAGLVLDHLCRTPQCCNPAHLEPVTVQVNTLRGTGNTARNAAKTHCQHGHPLKGDNLYRDKRGHRECVICKKALGRARVRKS